MPKTYSEFTARYAGSENHSENDYFACIKAILNAGGDRVAVDKIYKRIFDEIVTNSGAPTQKISFGTSGWRGVLGKDIFVKSVRQVTRAIVEMYEGLETDDELTSLLGVADLKEAQQRGCVIGFDNRFGGEVLAVQAARVLLERGFAVFYAGESTTGVLSAAVLETGAAFSINLTPSHNPLEYGGYKFNAGDAGPAAPPVTARITDNARKIISCPERDELDGMWDVGQLESHPHCTMLDSFSCWKKLVAKGKGIHGLDLSKTMAQFAKKADVFLAIDCVHGASRLHIEGLLENVAPEKYAILRGAEDVTFGGVAPEPSSENIQGVKNMLADRKESLTLGAVIDPDGDRIRFTDGVDEISMNQFGALAYHYLHEIKGKKGMVAKTVASSNFANSIASALDEKVFEPAVGFKNFKPVIGEALVLFEESDGISIVGHTPEKDAYIGLLLALEITLETGLTLGDYLRKVEEEFGAYFPARDGLAVSLQGRELLEKLGGLARYDVGSTLKIHGKDKIIVEVTTIDGRKMILDDGSWIMIRPSGTEPKVRFYVESRDAAGTEHLVACAREMLAEVGVI